MPPRQGTKHPTRGRNVSIEVVMLRERSRRDRGLHVGSSSATEAQGRTWGLLAGMRRRWCEMLGHDLILHTEPGRMSVQCVDCGWESSGWLMDRPHFVFTCGAPRRTTSGRTRNRRLPHARQRVSAGHGVRLALVKSARRGRPEGPRRHRVEAASTPASTGSPS